ncbi:MAG: ribosome biogenesis GTPase Der [Nitrospiraceae bacterium]|nr:MAG: ribosome biogenesis GTPase Der [Nitrospiraceae bacterium]
MPVIAIVGRPNVGKSTLFNRMVKERRAVIEDIPGITRDRLYGKAQWDDKTFLVIDTGGFQQEPNEDIAKQVNKQVIAAVEEADIILLLMDSESGVLPSDAGLIEKLRKYGKRVFFAVNKIDGPRKEKTLYDFYSLGIDLFPLSALSGNGYEELMDSMAALLPEVPAEMSEYTRIAIVGRPNVGKSTLVNSLLGKERMIVSPVPGTTRDAVDSVCSYYGKKYTIVDTAGIRRKGRMSKTAERYSFMRTVKNIEDCDVALIVLDATEGVVELDQKIAGLVFHAKRGTIILLNKWDLVDKDTVSIKAIEGQVYQKLWFMRYAPILTISALSKQRVTKLFRLVDDIIEEGAKRIGTHELNEFLGNVLAMQEPPLYKGRRVKIYYITQIRTAPPGFAIFTNYKEGIKEQYIKFLEGRLRERFSFKGVHVEFYVRQKKSRG